MSSTILFPCKASWGYFGCLVVERSETFWCDFLWWLCWCLLFCGGRALLWWTSETSMSLLISVWSVNHRRLWCWCLLLTGTSAISMVAGSLVAVAAVVSITGHRCRHRHEVEESDAYLTLLHNVVSTWLIIILWPSSARELLFWTLFPWASF